jgi:hypothetical protein
MAPRVLREEASLCQVVPKSNLHSPNVLFKPAFSPGRYVFLRCFYFIYLHEAWSVEWCVCDAMTPDLTRAAEDDE